MPLEYTHQENAWMNSVIFNNYLEKLDKRLSSLLEPGKKALLVIDNCPAHPPSLVSNYTNIDLKFFPPNITSKAQPMDMGVIHSLKAHYKNEMSSRKNSAIGNNIQLKLNLLEAIHILKDSWEKVTESTFQNCFFKANFVICDRVDLSVEYNGDNDFEESFEDDDITTSEHHNFCVNNGELMEMSEDENDIIVDYEDARNDKVVISSLSNPNTTDVIKITNVIKNFLRNENPNGLSLFLEVEKEINHSIENLKKQTKITDFFHA